MVSVPETFIVNKFFKYAGGAKFNRHQNTYNGSCPLCREGKSWLKKKRCYYLPKKNVVCCHNCGWYGTPFNWIKEAGQYQINELIKEIKDDDGAVVINTVKPTTTTIKPLEILPEDSINLFNLNELSFWQKNPVVQKALEVIKSRRLDKAVNRPDAIYVSLKDKVHKNRLIIPFYDENNKILFYQTRKIFDIDKTPKYLSKVGQEKTLYGINNIDPDCNTVVITEGPIDAFFIKNGLAVAGITKSGGVHLTEKQSEQLNGLKLFEKIWLLDNQYLDRTSKEKTKKLLELGHKVFIWPTKKYKDINDLCVDLKINQLDHSFIERNTYTRLQGLLKLTKS
jgi:hypothetical protein